MRMGILSDIHANLEALDAVLEDAERRSVEAWWFLGDAVGYGGDPEEVVVRTRALHPLADVRGNHDKVVAGIEEPEDFADHARDAALRSRELITPATRAYLASLRKGPVHVVAGAAICHGSWADEDLYLIRKHDIQRTFETMATPLLFFGHTHRACLYAQLNGSVAEVLCRNDEEVALDRHCAYLVNPGSVGQPRDRDPRAAYAVFDVEEWTLTFCRLAYDIESAQQRILAAGLPELNAARLVEGR
jgi:predicted phosphodiesterase